MDVSMQNVMFGDIQYDISEMLSALEEDISNGSTLIFRNDSFKEGFENIFNVNIDDIDNVEQYMQENSNGEDLETKIQLYSELVSKIRGFFDTYFGITFNERPTSTIDLNKLYMVYRTVYVNFLTFIAHCIAGRCLNEKIKNVTKNTILETINDENVFTTDNIREWLFISDPGNEEYEYIFGVFTPPDEDDIIGDNEEGISEVCIDNFAFRARVCKDIFDKNNEDDFIDVIKSRVENLLKNI